MAGAQPYHWTQQHKVNSLCFDLGTDSMEHNLRELQQQQVEEFENKFPQPHSPAYPSSHQFPSHPTMPRLPERDQVVPSFQRLTVYEHGQPCVPCRDPKPLPPLPDPEELSSDEAADEEVEFFTDDRRRLLPKRCPKTFALRYGAPGRRSFRGCGQVNYAYHEAHAGASAGAGSGAASGWTSSASTDWAGSGAKSVVSMDSVGWTSGAVKVGPGGGGANSGAQGPWSQRTQGEQTATAARDAALGKQPDRPQRAKLRRSHSERRLAGHHHGLHHHPQGGGRESAQDKPEVPPRAPVPPRPAKIAATDWSAHGDDEDKPPKVPPRVPLHPCVPPRTPSPKSLPIYVNGVMPPTQSFAPNPKYVSKAPLRLPQQSEGACPPDAQTPCIVPIMEDGRKASATHYFLLPRRPPYMDRLERFLREADCEAAGGACCSEWGCHNGQKPPLQLM